MLRAVLKPESLPGRDDHRLAATRAGIKISVELLEAIDQGEGDEAVEAANRAFDYFLRFIFPIIRHADFPDCIDGLEWRREMFYVCDHEALIGGLTTCMMNRSPLM
ncbi:MAG: hypothetical protein ACXV47_08560 [Halobacteriota archaeon]